MASANSAQSISKLVILRFGKRTNEGALFVVSPAPGAGLGGLIVRSAALPLLRTEILLVSRAWREVSRAVLDSLNSNGDNRSLTDHEAYR